MAKAGGIAVEVWKSIRTGARVFSIIDGSLMWLDERPLRLFSLVHAVLTRVR